MVDLGSAALQWIILSVMLFGLFSLLIPIIPGLVIIWVAGLVYGLVTGFTLTGGIIFAVMTILMIGGSLVDNVLMGASARKTGASWVSIIVALAAGLVGSLIWPPLGGLFAALIGIFLVEFYRHRDWRKAFESTRGMAFGCGWAVAVRLLIGAVMIGLYALWAFVF
ncbi:MAG TPA: DUF456 domain-containing protein [Anaerolineaceae bacterium]|nr:DUF456 domain-containing protein [Anaerolineaceae bacterium]